MHGGLMRNHFCRTCGLEFRKWVRKTHNTVCDQCEPEKFKELHTQNLRLFKTRKIGQEHLTESTWFPKENNQTKGANYRHKYRRQQK